MRLWFLSHMSVKSLFNLNVPIPTKVVCFSGLLKCLRSLYSKQCGPRSDCSYRSSLFWVLAVCFYTKFVSIVRQLFAADDFSRRHFQMHFFLGALRVKHAQPSCAALLFAYWVIFHAFLSSADFFQNQLFRKILAGIQSENQTV